MQITTLPVTTYLAKAEQLPVIDVRSEKEFEKGHIPRALNLPLLNNDERVIIGTLYKQSGREAAVEKGFELVGGKFHLKIKEVQQIVSGKELLLNCWRGGMRSNIMAWVLSMAGYKVYVLKEGYKAYRNWVLDILAQPRNLIVLGGPTGSGKTRYLELLAKEGNQVVDLENIASHKGSAFGTLGMPSQPTNEQFENNLALVWNKTSQSRPVWVENESRMVGTVKIPDPVFSLMSEAPLLQVNIAYEARLARILSDYGSFSIDELEACTTKLKKRLGDLRLKTALDHLRNGRMKDWADMMLSYYDGFYAYSASRRDPKSRSELDLTGLSESEALQLLSKKALEYYGYDNSAC